MRNDYSYSQNKFVFWFNNRKRILLFFVILVVLTGSSFSWLRSKQINAWEKPLPASNLRWDAKFRLVNWRKLEDSSFSPVKDDVDSEAEKTLESRSFVAISESQARAMSIRKLHFTNKKRIYLIRGIFYSYSDENSRGFTIFTSEKRVWVSQTGMGHYRNSEKKALVVLLDFLPAAIYCDASEVG